MIKYLLLAGLFFSTGDCFSQEIECNKFHTGDLAYRDSSGVIWEIKRTRTRQTEFNPNTKLKLKYKIEWISECEYKLIQLWASTKEKRKMNRYSLNYRIVGVKDNTYEYSCTCSDHTKVAGVVVKL